MLGQLQGPFDLAIFPFLLFLLFSFSSIIYYWLKGRDSQGLCGLHALGYKGLVCVPFSSSCLLFFSLAQMSISLS